MHISDATRTFFGILAALITLAFFYITNSQLDTIFLQGQEAFQVISGINGAMKEMEQLATQVKTLKLSQEQIQQSIEKKALSMEEKVASIERAASDLREMLSAKITTSSPAPTTPPPPVLETKCVFAPDRSQLVPARNNPPFKMCVHRGDEMISNAIRSSGQWGDCQRLMPLAEEVLKRRKLAQKDLIVVDVGANIGSCTFPLAAEGYTVFSFEPNPRNVELLRSSILLNTGVIRGDVILVEAGAANESHTFPIFSDADNAGNSVVGKDTNNSHLKAVLRSISNPLMIRVLPLDKVIRQHVHLLKMDCQGCEVSALRGARDLFLNHGVDVVATEFAPEWIRSQGEDPAAFFTLLQEYDMDIFFASGGQSLNQEALNQLLERGKSSTFFLDLVAKKKVKPESTTKR